jgi:hypothetical protein
LGGVAAVEVAHVETRRFHKRFFHQSHEPVKERLWDIARWVKVFVPPELCRGLSAREKKHLGTLRILM